MKNITGSKDTRLEATFIIWGCGTGMMGICIPLVSISGGGLILPLLVILGASISTIFVWQSDDKKQLRASRELQQIERRIEDLETICSK